MKIQTVVFDMDGVLFDTERLCMKGWREVGHAGGYGKAAEMGEMCIGLNANDTRALILSECGEDFPFDAYMSEISAWMRDSIDRGGLPVKDGVREILQYLKENGFRIALASSSRRESVMRHLERAGLTDYFETVIGGDMVKHSKPRPDIYRMACGELGINPAEAYAIEDSPNGIRAAYSAGMQAIMVPDLIAPTEEMRQLSCVICKDLFEAKQYIEEKNQ